MKKSLIITLSIILLSAFSVHASEQQNPRVEVQTNMGKVTFELYQKKAPITVNNFLGYVKSGYYSGTIFHRVIKDFMIQGGGYTSDYKKKNTLPTIKNEADNGLKNTRGTIAMARLPDPHSASAQFFINTVDNNFLNHTSPTSRGWGYAVFGRVVEGMDTVDQIRNVNTGRGGPFPKDVPSSPIIIEKMTLITAN